jgi:hypothetical protein
VLAYLLIDHTLRDVLAPHERFLLAVFYWLNPWQLYFAGHLWNVNWLFLAGAVHLWTVRAQRVRGLFWISLVHVVNLGLAFQIHSSFMILVLASMLLWWRRYFRIQFWGAAVGAGLILLSLIPWLLTALEYPQVLPMQGGFPGRGLVTVYPVIRGIGYWLRYPMLYFAQDLVEFDFTPVLGPAVDRILAPTLALLTRLIAPLTILISLAANVWFFRRRRGSVFRGYAVDGSRREWLHGYVRWALIASVLAFCMSPTTIMMWQALVVLHAAILPVVLWLGALWRTRAGPRVRTAMIVHIAVLVGFGVTMAFVAPMYRVGGRDAAYVRVPEAHPMLDRLDVTRRSTVWIDPVGGEVSCLLQGAEGWAPCAAAKDSDLRM